MPRTRAIRFTVVAVCVAGIAGMIVTSATDHNGAAITFGLVTAVAVLCQMTATTVLNEAKPPPNALNAANATDEADASDVEERIVALVDSGADEGAVRDLARRAVRLGRHLSSAGPPDF